MAFVGTLAAFRPFMARMTQEMGTLSNVAMGVIASLAVKVEPVHTMAANCAHSMHISFFECDLNLKGESMTKLIRYRMPSPKTMLGVTRAKKRINKQLGITAIKKPIRVPENMERRVLRHAGYYSGPMKLTRFLGRIFK